MDTKSTNTSNEKLQNASISIAMITCNSARTLEKTLQAVAWANEIVIVDDHSKDATLAIAKKFGAKIINHKFENFYSQKQIAVDHCLSEWILVLDDDEYLTEALSKEIKRCISQENNFTAYKIPRTLLFLDKKMSIGSESKKPILRLFQRTKAVFNQKMVHEGLEVKIGNIGFLKNEMLHDSFESMQACLQKMDRYALLWAQEKKIQGKKISWLQVKIKYFLSFFQTFVLGLQFMNGKRGRQWSQCTAFYNSRKYEYLFKMKNL